MNAFDYSLDYKTLDIRNHPELYRVGRGEQGVLLVQPYKSEILPYWRFKTPPIAKKSAMKIYSLFLNYKRKKDFVGMDMARKFLQMGYTRSRRYANHATGTKYKNGTKSILPQEKDWATNEKAESARIFYEYYQKAKTDEEYMVVKKLHQKKYG